MTQRTDPLFDDSADTEAALGRGADYAPLLRSLERHTDYAETALRKKGAWDDANAAKHLTTALYAALNLGLTLATEVVVLRQQIAALEARVPGG